MQTNIITSEKALMRAIAATFVHNRKDIEKILKKHSITINFNNKNESLKKLLYQLQTNKKFNKDFVILMIKKGYLTDANSSYHNVIGTAIIGVIGAVANVAGKALGNKQLTLEARNMDRQSQIDAENQMMQLIQEEEKTKQKKQTMNTVIITVSLLALIGTAIILIKNKNK